MESTSKTIPGKPFVLGQTRDWKKGLLIHIPRQLDEGTTFARTIFALIGCSGKEFKN
jgi:hypothetical protein